MRHLTAALALSLLASGALAQTTTYRSDDHLSPVPVDRYTPLPVQGGGAINVTGKVVSCSGTIAAGGTPQDLMPLSTTSRGGWKIQNQSTGDLYIRSKSATGTLTATTDQNSFKVPAGGFYEPDEVSDYAYSIVGATTGQAFHCNRW